MYIYRLRPVHTFLFILFFIIDQYQMFRAFFSFSFFIFGREFFFFFIPACCSFRGLGGGMRRMPVMIFSDRSVGSDVYPWEEEATALINLKGNCSRSSRSSRQTRNCHTLLVDRLSLPKSNKSGCLLRPFRYFPTHTHAHRMYCTYIFPKNQWKERKNV